MLLNKKALLPVSSLVQGAYDIRDICLSVPVVVGRKGVEKHVEIKLWPKEQMALQQSARALKETLLEGEIMMKSLDTKLAEIKANPASRAFIIADAKDADMAFGVRAPGPRSTFPGAASGRRVFLRRSGRATNSATATCPSSWTSSAKSSTRVSWTSCSCPLT